MIATAAGRLKVPNSKEWKQRSMVQIIRLNPIITDTKYIGLFDGDPRIAELSNRLINAMDKFSVFNDELISLFNAATNTSKLATLELAIDKLYDYADKNDIDLGVAGQMPADKE